MFPGDEPMLRHCTRFSAQLRRSARGRARAETGAESVTSGLQTTSPVSILAPFETVQELPIARAEVEEPRCFVRHRGPRNNARLLTCRTRRLLAAALFAEAGDKVSAGNHVVGVCQSVPVGSPDKMCARDHVACRMQDACVLSICCDDHHHENNRDKHCDSNQLHDAFFHGAYLLSTGIAEDRNKKGHR